MSLAVLGRTHMRDPPAVRSAPKEHFPLHRALRNLLVLHAPTAFIAILPGRHIAAPVLAGASPPLWDPPVRAHAKRAPLANPLVRTKTHVYRVNWVNMRLVKAPRRALVVQLGRIPLC